MPVELNNEILTLHILMHLIHVSPPGHYCSILPRMLVLGKGTNRCALTACQACNKG